MSKKLMRRMAAAAAALLVCSTAQARVELLAASVGKGDALLVRAGNYTCLIDTGKSDAQDNLERKPNRNVIKIAGRDGSFKERVLTDEQLAALAVLIDQLPDVPDDL